MTSMLSNQIKRLPFVYFALFYISGILLGKLEISTFFIIIISFSGLILLFIKKDRIFVAGLLICICCWGWINMQTDQAQNQNLKMISDQLNTKIISFKSPVEEITKTEKGNKYLICLDEFDQIKAWYFTKEFLNLTIGDTIQVYGEFQQFQPPRNPGEFDYQSFYNRKGIYGWIFANKDHIIHYTLNSKTTFREGVEFIRSKIRQRFAQFSKGVGGALLSALILGDQTQVDEEIRKNFAETGVIHVLAVSGLHVGYVLIILLIIKNMFRLPWGWDRIVIIIGLLIFVILTGNRPSVVRAAIMGGLYVSAPIVNRNANVWNIIFCAALIILIFNPNSLFDIGFQLSFLAVLSIVFFYNWLNKVLPSFLQVNNIQNKPFQFIWGLFLVSFSAQIGTLPITAYYFNKISVIALVANVIIVPLIGLLVGIGFFILFLGWIPFLGFALGESANLLSMIISESANIFAKFSISSIDFNFSLVNILIYYLILIGMVSLINQQKVRAILIGLILGNYMIWNWAFTEKYLDIIYLDVGQGDAILIRFPEGQNMLIDAGQRNSYEDMGTDVVIPVLKYLNIHEIDWAMMSHPHSDHIGGFVALTDEITIKNILDTFLPFDSWTYKKIMQNAQEKKTDIMRFERGQILQLTPNSLLEFYAPDTTFVHSQNNVNNASIVIKLIYGQTKFLFTGDLEQEGDDLLIQYNQQLKSHVLKVAHHGSVTSTTEELLDCVQPDIAVISVGKNNKFSHPSTEVLERLENRNIKIHRTDVSRALWLRSDGTKIKEVRWN